MKLIKLTKQEILNLNNALYEVGDLVGVKFAYAVSRNIDKLKPEIEALQKAHKPHEDFLVYEKERLALAKSHAVKVDNEPRKIIADGIERFVMKDQNKFKKELKPLQKKHKKVIDARKKQLDELADLLKEETNIELHIITPESIPQNITAKQMGGILFMVDKALPK